MNDIKRDKEITIDYAMVLYNSGNGPRYELECLCGDNKCRHMITDEDWKKEELQKKYHGYFQYFIQDKIDNGGR
jgi:hypothetical protein